MNALDKALAFLKDVGAPMPTEYGVVFSLMSVAESVLEEHGLETARCDDGTSMFMVIAPTPLVVNKTEQLYRWHAKELCERFKAGAPLKPATNAEVVAALMGAALKAPLNYEAMAVLKFCVEGSFLESVLADIPLREKWDGQVDETLAAMRSKLSTNRGLGGAL